MPGLSAYFSRNGTRRIRRSNVRACRRMRYTAQDRPHPLPPGIFAAQRSPRENREIVPKTGQSSSSRLENRLVMRIVESTPGARCRDEPMDPEKPKKRADDRAGGSRPPKLRYLRA